MVAELERAAATATAPTQTRADGRARARDARRHPGADLLRARRVQLRQTGETGLIGLRPGAGPVEALSGVSFIGGIVLGALSPVPRPQATRSDTIDALDSDAIQGDRRGDRLDRRPGDLRGPARDGRLLADRGPRLGRGALDLVTSGWFSVVRNPIYTSMITAWIGFFLMVPTWLGAVAALIAIARPRDAGPPGRGALPAAAPTAMPTAAYAARVGRFVPGRRAYDSRGVDAGLCGSPLAGGSASRLAMLARSRLTSVVNADPPQLPRRRARSALVGGLLLCIAARALAEGSQGRGSDQSMPRSSARSRRPPRPLRAPPGPGPTAQKRLGAHDAAPGLRLAAAVHRVAVERSQPLDRVERASASPASMRTRRGRRAPRSARRRRRAARSARSCAAPAQGAASRSPASRASAPPRFPRVQLSVSGSPCSAAIRSAALNSSSASSKLAAHRGGPSPSPSVAQA